MNPTLVVLSVCIDLRTPFSPPYDFSSSSLINIKSSSIPPPRMLCLTHTSNASTHSNQTIVWSSRTSIRESCLAQSIFHDGCQSNSSRCAPVRKSPNSSGSQQTESCASTMLMRFIINQGNALQLFRDTGKTTSVTILVVRLVRFSHCAINAPLMIFMLWAPSTR